MFWNSVRYDIVAVLAKLITTTEAAKRLGVTRGRVHQLLTDGRLPAEKVGVQWLIRPADLAKVKDRKPGRPKKPE